MVEQGILQNEAQISAQLAASLPRYDPLAPGSDRRTRRGVIIASVLLHLLALAVLWNVLIGAVTEQEETVVVRMVEEEIPVPEPPKLRRKILRQRVLDASVQIHKDIVQPEIVEVKPVPVLDRVQKIEVERTELTEAPKQIEHRKVVTENLSVFAERTAVAQPVQISKTTTKVAKVQAARPTAGPRKMTAAGPVTNARAVDLAAPKVVGGKISNNAIDGDIKGAQVAEIESGTSAKYLKGDGDRGALTGVERDCSTDPACQAYLKELERRVYARWNIPEEYRGGRVKIRFRLDRGGSAHSIQVADATDAELGETCLTAFRRASPFPPPPKEILYIINKAIGASFSASTSGGG